MPGEIEDRLRHDVEQLRSLAERCGGESPPSKAEVEDALELGFASLIASEAQLQRLGAGDVGAFPAPDRPSREKLARRIEMLREALTEVRRRTEPDGSSLPPPGFVLPGDR